MALREGSEFPLAWAIVLPSRSTETSGRSNEFRQMSIGAQVAVRSYPTPANAASPTRNAPLRIEKPARQQRSQRAGRNRIEA